MYRFYLKQGETQFFFPVTPSQVQTKVGNCNQTVQILQMGQANLLKNAGLEEVRFKALFPGRQYHFVQVEEGFREPSYFLERLKDFKKAQKPVQLIIFRRLADGSQIFCSNVEMGLEEYTILEQGGEQGDFWVEIAYRPASGGNTLEKQPTQRPAKETAKTYVVKKGDNLWNIAKKELGDGSKFGELAKKNGISNPSLIYPGQVIKL